MAKRLQSQAEYATKRTGRNAVDAAPGPNHSEPEKEVRAMADVATIPILSGKSTENNSGTWQPIGVIAARLIGGAK